jgi:hypothetical protein
MFAGLFILISGILVFYAPSTNYRLLVSFLSLINTMIVLEVAMWEVSWINGAERVLNAYLPI